MKSILLIGLGRYGRHVAMKLDELGHQVMAIDNKPERVESVLPYVSNGQIGDSTDEMFLKSLGIRNFDVCIVGIGDDFQSSLETASLLKELGAKLVVARASKDKHAKLLKLVGADEVVYPERQLANWTAIRFSADHIFDYIELDSDYGIFEVEVSKNWCGKTIGELDIRRKYKINIMGIRHNGKLDMDISANTTLEEKDTVLVLGKTKEVQHDLHL